MPAPTVKSQVGQLNFEVNKGTHFQRVLTWKDQDGNPFDLTGYSARMQVRSSVDATSPLYEMDTSTSGIALGGTNGTITLTIPAAENEVWDWDEGVYDLELVNASGEPLRLLEGYVFAREEVTR